MPNFDFLRPTLGDELFTQFSEKMNAATGVTLANIADGSYIPKAKFDTEHENVKTLRAQNGELNTQLTALQQQNTNATALNQRVVQLQSDIAVRDQKIEQIGLGYRIKDALRGMNVRNPDVVTPLLKMDSISEKDGKIVGLAEQIEEIKKTDGYLFATAPGAKGGFDGNQELGAPDVNTAVNSAIRTMSGRG